MRERHVRQFAKEQVSHKLEVLRKYPEYSSQIEQAVNDKQVRQLDSPQVSHRVVLGLSKNPLLQFEQEFKVRQTEQEFILIIFTEFHVSLYILLANHSLQNRFTFDPIQTHA